MVCLCVCLVKLQKGYKALFSPQFFGFVGWLILVCLGLEGLGVFVFLVIVSILFRFCCFVFYLVFVLLLDYFGCCSCFPFSFCFFAFLIFLEGLRVR